MKLIIKMIMRIIMKIIMISHFFAGESSAPEINSVGIKPKKVAPKIQAIDRAITQKWFIQVHKVVNQEYSFTSIALVDSGADLNCFAEGIVPSQYFTKTAQILSTVDGSRLLIDYKLSNAMVCNEGVCFETPFMLVKI